MTIPYHTARVDDHYHNMLTTNLVRPGTVHDKLVDDEKGAMDTVIPTQASTTVTLRGPLCHTTNGLCIGPLCE